MVKVGLPSGVECVSVLPSLLMNFFSAPPWAILGLVLSCSLFADEKAAVVSTTEQPVIPGSSIAEEFPAQNPKSHEDGSVAARRNARTMTLSIPGPRGMITDRNGEPLAQNKVGYYFALEFPLRSEMSDEEVIAWARKRVTHAHELQGLEINLSDKRILEHYRHRRWVPLQFAYLVGPGRAEEYRDQLTRGLILHPVYYRYYPQKKTLSHLVGYVRSKGKLPTGPINFGDPLFEETHGVAGLENTFDLELTGKSGLQKIIFDSDGSRLLDEFESRPEVGKTVVTSLNLKWQKHAESVLARSCKRGAFVCIDIQTGDVLVMASRPSYDNNVWIPRISQADFEELRDDPSKPMFGRAFQAGYPPASAFKPVVALSALNNGIVGENSLINCPAYIKIGASTFRNHSKYPAGNINVKKALALSNNVWFYKVGIRTRADNFLSVARRLGFGSPTGLPLFGETSGLIPNDAYMVETLGRGTTEGDTANWSIGQGAVSASPLQVAQAMAGIGNGMVLPKLRLVLQVQDAKGGVISAPEPEARNSLTLSHKAMEIVHRGMRDVVHAPSGTGKRGAVSFCSVAGKTGTAQWVKDRELAWFAGFLPYDNPRFAFAALYEGMPGESVSGGKKAAPMIPRFFNPLSKEFKEILAPPSKALVIIEEEEAPPSPAEGILNALPAQPLNLEEQNPAEPEPIRAIPVETDDLESPEPAEPVEEESGAENETDVETELEEEGGILKAEPVEEEEVTEATEDS